MFKTPRRKLAAWLYLAARRIRARNQRLGGQQHIPSSLFSIAAGANHIKDRHDLMQVFLGELTRKLHCSAACIHCFEDGVLKLETLMNIGPGAIDERISLDLAINAGHPFVAAFSNKKVVKDRYGPAHQAKARGLGHHPRPIMLCVPVISVDNVVAMISLFFGPNGPPPVEDDFLLDLGRFLALALDKVNLDAETQRLISAEQRTILAGELHDSLAQTLATMNLQLLLIKGAIKGQPKTVQQPINALSHTLDEANNEIRELIEHFRIPMNERNLSHAITREANRLRDRHGMQVLVQLVGPQPNLPNHISVELMRIVQESLTNIAKHAHANSVRIRLAVDESNTLELLIEDDGLGFNQHSTDKSALRDGYHVGLNIMDERAARIGASLSIESEKNEGTSVYCQLDLSRSTTESSHAHTDY